MGDKELNIELNRVLVELFHDIMDIEARAIITEAFSDISNNDMHIIEAIGIHEPQMVSAVAKRLSVTQGTINVAMNALEKKGYINRNRSDVDRRVVLVTLTEKGTKAYHHHREFHRKMMHAIVKDLTEEEKIVLAKSLQKLNQFFESFE